VIVALIAPLVSPYAPTSQLGRRLQLPSSRFLLGTDEFGRDILSRIIYGTRISLYVGAISVGMALLSGGLIGLLSGFYGGLLDNLLMRLVDIVFSIPSLILAIAIAGLLGPNLRNAMIAIGIVYAPTYARLIRAAVLTVKNLPYIEAATVTGSTTWNTITRHLLPNIMPPMIVQTSLLLSTAILAEAALSFLGLGTQPPDPSWGTMVNTGQRLIELSPWPVVFPGLAIIQAVLGFKLLGDGLRDVFDPRMRV
jgi:peptide/nickel transport system permease protein